MNAGFVRQGEWLYSECLMAGREIAMPATAEIVDVLGGREGRRRQVKADRLFRLARIAAQASAALGSEEKASHWLHAANHALGGGAPLELLDTDLGARQVEELLGRIEHGVNS
jgi:putative toxin-antitoxin system antitoxin component (TIGR02293 family)